MAEVAPSDAHLTVGAALRLAEAWVQWLPQTPEHRAMLVALRDAHNWWTCADAVLANGGGTTPGLAWEEV